MLRIVFSFLLCLFLIGFYGGANADSLYEVTGVAVDVADESSVKARTKAFAEAQQKAFAVLAGRFGQADRTATPEMVSALVQDFEITNEQLSHKRYKGIFTIRFRESAVNGYFGNIPEQNTDSVEVNMPDSLPQQAQQPTSYSAEQNYPESTYKPKFSNQTTSSKLSAVAVAGTVRVKASYPQLQDWVRLQNLLKNSPSVSSYKIVSLKVREAELDLSYADWTAFMAQLASAGFRIQSMGDGTYRIYK